MNNKENSRVSFSKEKVGQFSTGPTGITGTSDSQMNPTSGVKMVEGSYSASDCLMKNIEALANRLPVQDDVDEIIAVASHAVWENEHDDLDLSHEELLLSLDKIATINPISTLSVTKAKEETVVDNFCRNCGQKFSGKDNFCGNCGNKKIEAKKLFFLN